MINFMFGYSKQEVVGLLFLINLDSSVRLISTLEGANFLRETSIHIILELLS